MGEDGLRLEEISLALEDARVRSGIAPGEEGGASGGDGSVSSSASKSLTGSEGGDGALWAGIGGACAAVVVLVYAKQRMGPRAAASRKSDRNVVAFENPLYDSNEDINDNAGGYLDVQPDDDDSDE